MRGEYAAYILAGFTLALSYVLMVMYDFESVNRETYILTLGLLFFVFINQYKKKRG